MVMKTVYHFVDSNLEVEISSKKSGYQKKREGGDSEVVLQGRGENDLPCGRKGLLGGPWVGGTILINYKMNFIQDSCPRFFLYFKSTFHLLTASSLVHHTKIHIS